VVVVAHARGLGWALGGALGGALGCGGPGPAHGWPIGARRAERLTPVGGGRDVSDRALCFGLAHLAYFALATCALVVRPLGAWTLGAWTLGAWTLGACSDLSARSKRRAPSPQRADDLHDLLHGHPIEDELALAELAALLQVAA
jgi:hypothetical protein